MAPSMRTAVCRMSRNVVTTPQHASRRLPFRPLYRPYSAKPQTLSAADPTEGEGPNMTSQEHVSEEAAKMAEITGGQGPDLTQGTPVQDILKNDPEAQKHAPQVMKESLSRKNAGPKPSTRPFSTYARSMQSLVSESSASSDLPVSMLASQPPMSLGHKFPLPSLPIESNMRKDHRYDPVLQQCTNLVMRDGRLSVAQRVMSHVLQHLRTAPAPTYNPNRPLITGAPPASYLALNPIMYLTLAIDSISPLIRIRSQRGAAGGGVALQVPTPLNERQRRRKAFTWILDAASSKPSRGSGRDQLAHRVAEEVIAVVEGKSALWEKKIALHKLATTQRINVNFRPRKGSRRF